MYKEDDDDTKGRRHEKRKKFEIDVEKNENFKGRLNGTSGIDGKYF